MKIKIPILLSFIAVLIAGCSESRQKPVLEYVVSNPADTGSRFPDLYHDPSGELYMSWVRNVEENIFMSQYSIYRDGRWSAAETIHIGSDYHVSPSHSISVTGNRGEPSAAHRYRASDSDTEEFLTEFRFRDQDRGRWEETFGLPDAVDSPSHQLFVRSGLLADGSLLVVWLEAPLIETEPDDGPAEERREVGDKVLLQTALFSADGDLLMNNQIDEEVCGHCSIDLTGTGNEMSVVYRGGVDGEVRIARFNESTLDWGTPEVVQSASSGSLARLQAETHSTSGAGIDMNGRYTAVVWDTPGEESDNCRNVYLTYAVSGEAGFRTPIAIAGTDLCSLGRPDALVADSGEMAVSWLRQSGEQAAVMLSFVSGDGTVQQTVQVGITSASQSSGTPRIARAGESVMIAWTQTAPTYRVRTARVPLENR